MATVYKIHPAIGVARVGNHPDAFFVGPEAPGSAGVEIGLLTVREKGRARGRRHGSGCFASSRTRPARWS